MDIGNGEPMDIREENPQAILAIRRVNELAFEQPGEADLVDSLRSSGGVSLSLVAVDDTGTVVGHILFSPVELETPSETMEAFGLGPMAVLPTMQRQGIGGDLIREGIQRLRRSDKEIVVVLGHPEYYPRFGFQLASNFGVHWEHDAPDEAFMLLELRPGALEGRGGVVRYRSEFDIV
jgi:putative acetyltransferase